MSSNQQPRASTPTRQRTIRQVVDDVVEVVLGDTQVFLLLVCLCGLLHHLPEQVHLLGLVQHTEVADAGHVGKLLLIFLGLTFNELFDRRNERERLDIHPGHMDTHANAPRWLACGTTGGLPPTGLGTLRCGRGSGPWEP